MHYKEKKSQYRQARKVYVSNIEQLIKETKASIDDSSDDFQTDNFLWTSRFLDETPVMFHNLIDRSG